MKLFLSLTVLAVLASSLEGKSFNVNVIGGEEAAKKEFPFVVSLRAKDPTKTFKCAGALIGKKYVITSASCIVNGEGFGNTEFQVVAGDRDLGNDDDGEETVDVAGLKLHTDWKINDIALVQLAHELTESDSIKIIPLADVEKSLPHTTGKILGWGDNEAGALLNILKKADLTINDGANCQKRNEDLFKEGENFCAGSAQNGACSGDRGSPFIIGSAASPILYGLVREPTCTADSTGSLFTRVGHFVCWIKREIGSAHDGPCQVSTVPPTPTTTEAPTTTTPSESSTTSSSDGTTTATPTTTPVPTTTSTGGPPEDNESTTAGSGMAKYNALLFLILPVLTIFRN